MDWHCRWLTNEPYLARWEARPFSVGVERGPQPHDKRDCHERVVGCEAPGLPEADGSARRIADAILRFDVFPQGMLGGVMRHEHVAAGVTIGLRYHFVPGIDLFFAARVVERFENTSAGKWRCGFTYRTIAGHPACGEETFIVEKDLGTGQVVAALRSWSRPGLLLARLTYPIMRWLQLRAARSALDHLQALAHPDQSLAIHFSGQHLLPRRNLRTNLFGNGR